MKVLMIPSYFQTAARPSAGIFVADQARALHHMGIATDILFADVQFSNIFKSWSYFLGNYTFEKSSDVPTYRSLGWSLPKRNRFLLDRWVFHYQRLFTEYLKKEQRPDLLHAHTYWGGYAAFKIAEQYHLPFIVTEHSSDLLSGTLIKQKWKEGWLREVYSQSNHLIAVSHTLKKKMSLYTNRSISVIPNLVDTALFHLQPKKAKEYVQLIIIGDLVPVKRFELAIEALYHLQKKEQTFRLLIIGQGPEEWKLKKLVTQLELLKQVRFLGELPRPAVAKYLQGSDLLLITSQYETFGTIAIEALACGVPVVATPCGGPEDYIHSGNGRILSKPDSETLANTIADLSAQLNTFAKQKMRQEVIERFSSKAVAKQLIEVYEEVLK